ncbi:MAG: hypothetical protein K0R38_6020 [Polyangiaceae bacterium]|jgi:hypothetical protein|nr:hypothetical protein [Polyangiaceae bacterium]
MLTLFLMVACGQGTPPRQLRVELPEVVSSTDPVLVHARAVQQDGSSAEAKGKLDYRVTPPELAQVRAGGALVCQRSGEGTVAVTLLGVEGRAKLVCKLAARLEGPPKLKLDAATGEADPPWSVVDAAGKALDLPLNFTSDRANVVQVRGGRLVPASVGKATLTGRAGHVTQQFPVEVVRTLKPEVLPIDQNRRISYSLDAGKYRLSLKLASPHRVTVDWLGAPYCAYRGEAAEHVAECTLQNKGSVSFDNPAFLRSGDTTPSVDGVTLQEVP